jgi:SP family general alpha glucoside:H+ symporter-like MFS transporter
MIVYFCPVSPWWLVRKGRLEEAAQSIRRLTNPEVYTEADVQNTIAMMEHTTALEIEASAGASYIDCFRKSDRRRTEISCFIFAAQLTSGQSLIGK